MPISTLVMSSQFPTIFRSQDSMKSVSFLVTPSGASHVQYLFAASKKGDFIPTRLFSSKSRSLSPHSFLLPVPKGPMHFKFSYSNFGIEVTLYYVMAAGFLVNSFFKFFFEHLHCFVIMVTCRGIDLYDL